VVMVTRRDGASPPDLGSTRVRIERADAADRAAMQSVVEGIARSGRLGGVFHAAGENSVVPLSGMNRSDIERMFAGKSRCAQILHELTAGMPLECFVLFSSAAAVWGSARLAHYAAANGFLDGIAALRSCMGLPALSLQFGRLSERGMVPEHEYRLFDRMGLLPLPVEDAWDAMARLIAGQTTHAVLARVDWRRFLPVYQSQGARRTLFADIPIETSGSQTAPARELWRDVLDLPAPARAAQLTARVGALVGQVLGFTEAAVPLDRGLFELGLDSLTAVELRGHLSAALGLSLPATLLYEHPTVRELAGHLHSELFHEAAAPSQPRVDENGLLSQIESLPDEEVDRLFSELVLKQAGS